MTLVTYVSLAFSLIGCKHWGLMSSYMFVSFFPYLEDPTKEQVEVLWLVNIIRTCLHCSNKPT